MGVNPSLPCRLGGAVTLTAAPGGQWSIGHTSGPRVALAPSYETAWFIMAGLSGAATHGEADSYAAGLLSQGMTDLDRFLADPENQPSPGGRAALLRAFT